MKALSIFLFFVALLVCVGIGYILPHESPLTEGSEEYLHGKKLDLPEELLAWDSTKTLAVDTTGNVIHIYFKN